LSATTTIRALAFKDGLTASESVSARYTILADKTPAAVSAVHSPSPTVVIVHFDEPVEQASAQKSSNYTIKCPAGGSIIPRSATLSANTLQVTLTTDSIASGAVCTLLVSGVRDRASQPNTLQNSRTPFYRSTIPQDMVHYWKLDESQGAEARNEVSEDHGSVVGPLWRPSGGKINGALQFDGVDDNVPVGKASLPNPANGLTIATWLKADDFGVFDARLISKASGVEEADHVFMLSTFNNNAIRFRLRANGTTTTLISAANVVTAGSWHHVVALYDGSAIKLYVDTVVVGTVAKSGALNEPDITTPCALGNQPNDNSKAFDGLLDEVYIYNRPLSSEEIGALYSATAGSPPSSGRLPSRVAQGGPRLGIVRSGQGIVVSGWVNGGYLPLLSDAAGRRIKVAMVPGVDGLRIQMKDLPRGIYFLHGSALGSGGVIKLSWL
jgi:hypothetical protein